MKKLFQIFYIFLVLFCFKGEATCPEAFNPNNSNHFIFKSVDYKDYKELQDKDLANKDVRYKNFRRKILIGVDLRGTDARGADFRNSIFYDVKVDKNTKIKGAKFLGAVVDIKTATHFLHKYLKSRGLTFKEDSDFAAERSIFTIITVSEKALLNLITKTTWISEEM